MGEHLRQFKYDDTNASWRMVLLVLVAGAIALAATVGCLFMLYRQELGDYKTQSPKVFPTPRLNLANDRTSGWRLAGEREPNAAALHAAMRRVIARGSAAYEPGDLAP